MTVAVVTGAGSGVGQALSVELARRGWDVALIGHGAVSLEQTADLLLEFETEYTLHTLDVADTAAVNSAADIIVEEMGPIDAWINVAAVGIFGPLSEMNDNDLDRAMAVSYNGVVHSSRAAVRHMATEKHGTVVNIGSALSFTAVPYNVPYGAAKAAVRSFSLGLGLEARSSGITVCVAHLPAIASPWFAKVKTLTPTQSRPVGPMHTPASVARALADLVEHPRFGDSYLGLSTLFVVMGARAFPRLTGWFAQRVGVRLQTTKDPAPTENNLWESVNPPPLTPSSLNGCDRTPRWWPRRR